MTDRFSNYSREYDYLVEKLGKLSYRSMFGHFAVLHDNHVVVRLSEGKLFVRIFPQDIADFAEYIGRPLDTSSRKKLHNYFNLNVPYNHPLILMAIKRCIEQSEKNFNEKLNHQLRALPNLSAKHERLLNRVNITTVQQLAEIGTEEAIRKLTRVLPRTALKDCAFKLEGAITGKHQLVIDEERKLALEEFCAGYS